MNECLDDQKNKLIIHWALDISTGSETQSSEHLIELQTEHSKKAAAFVIVIGID